jgi:hypothetical protein
VIGPFPAHVNGRNGLSLHTPVEDQLNVRGDGSIDFEQCVKQDGRSFRWQCAKANRRGFVDLGKLLGKVEWAVAYAYAEIEEPCTRSAILRCGSDDGIQIWLNGQIVHRNEIGRAYTPDSDQAPVQLVAGRNRILVKIDNYHGGWGFGVAIK